MTIYKKKRLSNAETAGLWLTLMRSSTTSKKQRFCDRPTSFSDLKKPRESEFLFLRNMPNNENEESTPLLGTSNPGKCFDFNIFSITFYLKHNRIDKVVITLNFFYRIDILKPRLKIKHTSGCSKCWRRVCTSPGWTCSNLSRRSAPTILYNCDWRNASRDV